MPFARVAALSLALLVSFAFSVGHVAPQELPQNAVPTTDPPATGAWVRPLSDPETVKAWGPIFVGLAAILISSIFNFFQARQSRAQLGVEREKVAQTRETSAEQMQRERSKQELADIATKLNSFYGPFQQLREQSRQFYLYFARSEKEAAQKSGEDFRALVWLAEKKPLSDADRELLEAILKVSDSLLALIENQAGVVDKPALQDLLGRYAAHIRLLKLASAGKLPSLGSVLSEIAYPRAIDGAVESAVLRLQDRQRELTSMPSKPEPPKAAAPSSSVEYYNKNADAYTSTTALLDLRDLYKPFLEHLPAGARILDAGCGSGRDTRAFIELGYRVVSVDASIEMVRKCRDYPHAYCIQADLRELAFKEEFDRVWACAVLQHLSQDDARRAAHKLVTALKPGGYLFVSVKEGDGSITEPDGRFFQYYDEKGVRGLLAEDFRIEPKATIWSSPGVQGTPTEQIWINALFRRVPTSRV
jgi:SAM-dependent methyltransferase